VWPKAPIDHAEFGTGVGFSTTVTEPFIAGVAVAFRGASGDPIDANGVLSLEYLDAFLVDPVLRGETIGRALPLDVGEELVGSVLLFQYLALLPNNELVISDVFGLTLVGGASQGLAAGASQSLEAGSASGSGSESASGNSAGPVAIGSTGTGSGASVVEQLRAQFLSRVNSTSQSLGSVSAASQSLGNVPGNGLANALRNRVLGTGANVGQGQ
jgi:hypothetical protein